MGKYLNRITLELINKEQRDKRRYTQHDMAVGTNLTDSAISRILSYEALDNVPFGSIIRIARWLEVHPYELFEESEADDEQGES
jgi:transcriptional regulator with XRE-family HTH domain